MSAALPSRETTSEAATLGLASTTLGSCSSAGASEATPGTRTSDVAIKVVAHGADDEVLPDAVKPTPSDYSKLGSQKIGKEAVAKFFSEQIQQHDKDCQDIHSVEPHPIFYSPNAAISFKDVSFSINVVDPATNVRQRRLILAPCSGHFAPGKLVAIMGPSGCGKSTLLDILAGRKTSGYEGEVYINGHRRDSLYSRLTAYVPQSDTMHAHQTVREAITFNFLLTRNLPKQAVGAEVRANLPRLIDMHLTNLGLFQVGDTKIGDHTVRGISGGQKRRVTLAKGLVSGANVLFCDEPTSGLSSTDAEVAVKRMKMFTKKMGVSIFVVIHQPKQEVAALFDELLLLTSEPGRIVYNGPMRDTFAHYAAVGFQVPPFVNPADFYLDLVSPSYAGQEIDAFVSYYESQCAPAVLGVVEAQLASPGVTPAEILRSRVEKIASVFGPPAMPADAAFAAPFHRQLATVFARSIRLRWRDKASLKADFGSSIVKGVIVGIAFDPLISPLTSLP